MTLDVTRRELDKIIKGIPEFKESTRGSWLYNAKDNHGDKVKVQFKGNNFKIMVGDLDVLIKSVPLSKLKVEKVDAYLRNFLQRKPINQG